MKDFIQKIINKPILGFEKQVDVLVFVIALLMSVGLLIEKLLFIASVYEESVDAISFLIVVATNSIVFLTLCFWVVLLLRKQSHLFLRLYVLFFGFLLYAQLRLIQSGEISTRQGVEFPLVEHLALMVFGHDVWKQIVFEYYVKLHLVVIFFAALFLKVLLSSKPAFEVRTIGFFVLFFITSFITPSVNGVPFSLAHNSLVHVVKTAWKPVSILELSNETPSSVFKVNENAVHVQNDFNKNNVVLIILESTGANRLDFYDSDDALAGSTPFLKRFASNGVILTDTQAVMTSTSKSLVSILCGIEPYFGLSSFNATLGIPVDCLPKRLASLGYKTAFFQSAHEFYERRDLLTQKMGFEHFVALESIPESDKANSNRANVFGMEDEVMLDENQRWLNMIRQEKKPFFTSYLTLAQHFPYYSPDKKVSFNLNDSQKYQENFNRSLTYVDSFIEKLVNQYKQAGLFENTVFVVVGDHGESFGIHHPQRFHNNTMYREGIWVPFFIVNEKLFPSARKINTTTSLLDVSPTIEDVLGIKINSQYRGDSAFSQSVERRVFSACWYPARCLAAVDSQYKYIFNFNDMPEELYDRQADILEKNNIASENDDLLQSYRNATLSWYKDVATSKERYFLSIDEDFRNNPESYYRFPLDFFTGSIRVKDNQDLKRE